MSNTKAALAALAFTVAFLPAPADAAGPVALNPDPYFTGSIGNVAGKGNGESIFISRDRCCGGEPRGPYANIYSGGSSTNLWPDTDLIYVPANRDIRCGWHASWGWEQNQAFNATGWQVINSALYCWVVTT